MQNLCRLQSRLRFPYRLAQRGCAQVSKTQTPLWYANANPVQHFIDNRLAPEIPLVTGSEMKSTLAADLKHRLYDKGVLQIQSEEMLSWLAMSGVSNVDLARFKQQWEGLCPDPFVLHREIDSARCAFTLKPVDTFGLKTSAEPEFAHENNLPWNLSSEDMVCDYTDKPREFGDLSGKWKTQSGSNWCDNPVARAMNSLMVKLLDLRAGSGCHSPANCEPLQSTSRFLFNMFAVRTFRDDSVGMIGDPSPEGVHSDGNAISCIVFVGRDNVLPGTGANRVFDADMPLGKYDEQEFQKPDGLQQHLIAECSMDKPFEAFVLLDRVVKHEGRPFIQELLSKRAHRDAYLIFLRSPNSDGSDRLQLSSPSAFCLSGYADL
jgi:hypothetical protein